MTNPRRYVNPALIQNTSNQTLPQAQLSPISSTNQINQAIPQRQQAPTKNIIFPWGNPKLLNPLPQDGMTPLPPYFRTTVSQFPSTKAAAEQSNIPLGIIINPSQVDDVPLIDYSQSDIQRCQRCSSFLSTYSEVTPDGAHWKCPFCQAVSQLEHNYTNSGSQRSTEFICPVYDMIAPQKFLYKDKIQPSFVVVIDLSVEAIQTGFTPQFLNSFKASLDSIDPLTNIGLITMSNRLVFYDFSRGTEFIITDLSDVAIPSCPMVPIQQCKEDVISVIDNLLANIQAGVYNTHGNCLGSALQLAQQAMIENGGVLLLSAAGHPTIGPHAIKARASDDEAQLTSFPQESSKFYRDIGFMLNHSSISVHLFCIKPPTQKYCELSIISVPCGLTAGACHYYTSFDPIQLHNDIFSTLSSQYLWDSAMKLRCSSGVKMNFVYSNCSIRHDTSYYPVLSAHNSIMYDLKVESDLKAKNVMFQAAVLWTNNRKQRIIRVFNFALPATDQPALVKSSLDEAALATYFLKRASIRVLQKGSKDAFDFVRNNFTTLCSSVMSQPNIPAFESLYHLIHSILASPIVRQIPNKSPYDVIDTRIANIVTARALSLTSALLYLYPRMIAVDASFLSFDSSTNSFFYDENKITNNDLNTSCPQSTQPLPLDSTSFGRGYCFVVHTIEKIFVWISPSINLNYLRAAFNVSSLEELSNGSFNLSAVPVLQTPQNAIIQQVINSCYTLSGKYLPTEIIPPGSPRENVFADILVDAIQVMGSNLTAFVASTGTTLH